MESQQPRRAILAIIIIAILVIIGAYVYFTMNQAPVAEPEIETIDDIQQPGVQYQDSLELPPLPPENNVVNSYGGKITAINESTGSITIETARGIKTVNISSSTQIVQRLRPTREQRLAGARGEGTALAETPYPGTLEVGDVITAVSEANIRGQEEFSANKIIITQ